MNETIKRQRINGFINRIAKIGIEVEGGWNAALAGHKIIRDSSVVFSSSQPQVTIREIRLPDGRVQRDLIEIPPTKPSTIVPTIVGEIVMDPPMFVTGRWQDWMRGAYPQHVNATCGLHIHMSFSHELNYQRLMCPDYTMAMVIALTDFGNRESIPPDHVFWNRVGKPNHEHCAHVYRGDEQSKVARLDYHSRGKSYDRYTAINYPRAKHKTIECRLLPMFGTQPTTPDDAEQAIRALQVVIDTTNQFLSKIRQREVKMRTEVIGRQQVTQEFGSWLNP